MPQILISEEYGYQYWRADLTDEEYEQLKQRWCTVTGINCLVPVTLIVPQAKRVTSLEGFGPGKGIGVDCHIHECDDSFLSGVVYKIPPTRDFHIDGKRYTEKEILDLRDLQEEIHGG